MSEFEAIQVMYTVREVGANDSMNFFTFVSAYLAVAYFVGAKLSKFQVWSITCLYSVWVVAPAMATYIAVSDIHRLGGPDIHPMFQYPLILPFLMATSWLVSILFMVQARKPKG